MPAIADMSQFQIGALVAGRDHGARLAVRQHLDGDLDRGIPGPCPAAQDAAQDAVDGAFVNGSRGHADRAAGQLERLLGDPGAQAKRCLSIRQPPVEAVIALRQSDGIEVAARPVGARSAEALRLPVRRHGNELDLENPLRRSPIGGPADDARTLHPVELPDQAGRVVLLDFERAVRKLKTGAGDAGSEAGSRGERRQRPKKAVIDLPEPDIPQVGAPAIGTRPPDRRRLAVRRHGEEFDLENPPRGVEIGRPADGVRFRNPVKVAGKTRRYLMRYRNRSARQLGAALDEAGGEPRAERAARQLPDETMVGPRQPDTRQVRSRAIGARSPEHGDPPVRRDAEELHGEDAGGRIEVRRPADCASAIDAIKMTDYAVTRDHRCCLRSIPADLMSPAQCRKMLPHELRAPARFLRCAVFNKFAP